MPINNLTSPPCRISPTQMSDFPYMHLGIVLQTFFSLLVIFARLKLTPMKVLIADDSSFILDRLQQMLKPLDEVIVVGAYDNGTDALAALQELKPDLAILDNKRPGIKGIDIIRKIRTENHFVKLMLLTFYSDSYYRAQAIKAGANYFFSKNEDFEKIPDVIAELKEQQNTKNL
jgi:DNA-binding NarL/FixJ family response regulator